MSLGNFLFPNFYISPPSQLYYPIDNEQIKYITYQYHRVFKNTYKKWKWINRISVVIEYDTETNMTKEILVKQDDNKAKVKKVTGFEFFIANFVITFSSIIIKLPKWVYTTLENTHSNFVNIKWLINIYLFKISQLGLRASLLLLKNKLLNGSK